MILRRTIDYRAADPRDKALSSAIVFRTCSLRVQTSHATRRACRTVMREQALQWRVSPIEIRSLSPAS